MLCSCRFLPIPVANQLLWSLSSSKGVIVLCHWERKGYPAALGPWASVDLQAPAVLPSQGQVAARIHLQAAGWGICPSKPLCVHCSQQIACVQDMLQP